MFGSKKISPDVRRTKFTTLIARDVVIAGDLEFAEGLRMDGHIKGNVTGKADSQALLVVSEHGKITGNVRGYDLIVNGTIVGDVIADHFVDLQANAHVTGNIEYSQLRMDCGATVDGKLTRRDAAVPVAAATGKPATPAPAASPARDGHLVPSPSS
ncbi:MAG: polymer-forming cytoskeletal protein [Proteobacteria bacterium]|nr:polymer-forming cytoskeletal protein [Pseudomonadota bacterium]